MASTSCRSDALSSARVPEEGWAGERHSTPGAKSAMRTGLQRLQLAEEADQGLLRTTRRGLISASQMAFALARLPGSLEERDQPFTLAICRLAHLPSPLPGLIGEPGHVEELGI
jgi:hypothetical protein